MIGANLSLRDDKLTDQSQYCAAAVEKKTSRLQQRLRKTPCGIRDHPLILLRTELFCGHIITKNNVAVSRLFHNLHHCMSKNKNRGVLTRLETSCVIVHERGESGHFLGFLTRQSEISEKGQINDNTEMS